MANDRPRILVTGANGQLGSELRAIAAPYSHYEFIFADRAILSLSDPASINHFFAGNTIDYCINCAAYTAVDKAETEKEAAFAINGDGPGYLATACKEQGAALIHISTDYVFDGTATTPYLETDPTCPIGAYGTSKLKGEEAVLNNNPNAIVIRTSWVYSFFGNNFVKTMLRLMKERESLNVVNDQLGSPTYAADLASAIMQIITQWNRQPLPANRIFNYSNSGIISWHDFARAIKEISGSKCSVHPIPGSQYPTPAKRPAYSVLDTQKIRQAFGIRIPEWKESLKTCLQLLLNS